VLSFPEIPGNDAVAAVFARVSPERSTPILSEAQVQVMADIKARQQAAATDPALNGQNARIGGAR
jgi:hypothetical protein